MPTGNDSPNLSVAAANCAYCAIGGLVGKSASEIITMVYTALGESVPTGTPDDGADGFEKYYLKKLRSLDPAPPGADDTLERQVRGIKGFLESKGCAVVRYAERTGTEAERFISEHPELTLFLVLAGEDPGFGRIALMPHWTTCQVQGGKGQYYDYQTKITRGGVRSAIKQRAGRNVTIAFDDTETSDKIIAPLGQEYDRAELKAILLKVSKPT